MTRNRGRGEDAKIQTEQGNSRRVRREALMRAYPYILLILTPPLSPRAAIWRSWWKLRGVSSSLLRELSLLQKAQGRQGLPVVHGLRLGWSWRQRRGEEGEMVNTMSTKGSAQRFTVLLIKT